jgi:hypothetical protein
VVDVDLEVRLGEEFQSAEVRPELAVEGIDREAAHGLFQDRVHQVELGRLAREMPGHELVQVTHARLVRGGQVIEERALSRAGLREQAGRQLLADIEHVAVHAPARGIARRQVDGVGHLERRSRAKLVGGFA